MLQCYETLMRCILDEFLYHYLSYPLHSFPFTLLLYTHTPPKLFPLPSLGYLLHKICSVSNKLEEHSCI